MDIKAVQGYFRDHASRFKGNSQTEKGCAQIKQDYVAWNTNPGGGSKARRVIYKLDVENGLIRIWMYTNRYWEENLQKLLGEKKIPKGAGLFPFFDERRTVWSIRVTADTIEDAVKKLNELYDAYDKDLKERGRKI